jgi:enoyl-CoA hydratase
VENILYEIRDNVALLTLNRPEYRNAQSWKLLDALDIAFDRAMSDDDVRVVVLRGGGGNFSSGHDLGTKEQVADERERAIPSRGLDFYDNFRKYNLDYTLKWRNLPKPIIAMVEGYCIFGGWMIAASADIVFASEEAQFLAGLVEYLSIPWDINPRKAKELVFESRFLSAREACELGFVNRVFPDKSIEAETLAYARRVAENSRTTLRFAKLAINKVQDAQGFTSSMESAFSDFLVWYAHSGEDPRKEGSRRMDGVDLAVRGLKGRRYGLPTASTEEESS